MALFGGLLRFIRLGQPQAVVFDETYYVKDAWTMLNTGEPRDWPATINAIKIDDYFANGQHLTDWLPVAEYVVHPPFGKWCIALGLQLFGGAANSFAWRVSTAVAGTLAILILCRVVLRIFRSLPMALIAGFLMSIDGMGITLSRTGLLDNFIMVLALGAFCCMLAHRDWANRRLADAYRRQSRRRHAKWIPVVPWRTRLNGDAGDASATGGNGTVGSGNVGNGSAGNGKASDEFDPDATQTLPPIRFILDSTGPVIAFSWWRLAAAILLGLTTGVKWSGAYFFAVFCLISVFWDAWLRRQNGFRAWFVTGLWKDGILAALYMVPVYIATYLATWIGWFIHPDSYMHDWARMNPGKGITWLPEGLRSFVQYHIQMWQFHTTLDAPHDYKANPLTWPIQQRPTSFYWRELAGHPGFCSLRPNETCVAAVTSLGNSLIWWLGTVCVVLGVIVAVVAKGGDWRIWAVLAGFLGGWLPWAQYLNRTTFTFYAIVILPWIILGFIYVADWLHGLFDAFSFWWVMGGVLVIITLVSVFFYPIWTAIPVPYSFWLSHMWFDSWI
ncbi:phospholipid carrier-dependent glycosyltransferase [Bifidobacterium callimiconis]|uniref:dolichyl-phosphate-mannose--protein mannosyltransferase n=1 Tax=Bifidobacterium callimiconis TaxID=2306973 RepID=UPI001BDC463C|nr:phospholipid carrier-dependent glycosyltransferase [Bifidobacterium callimiconis]MBT1177666.1 phospholipid carrier-dependent glycosyltransferase [Bifidobacterium callimiconis]